MVHGGFSRGHCPIAAWGSPPNRILHKKSSVRLRRKFKISHVRPITTETGEDPGGRRGAEPRVSSQELLMERSLIQRALAGKWHDDLPDLRKMTRRGSDTGKLRRRVAYMRGVIYGLAVVCIWGAFIVVSLLGVRTSLTSAGDVAASTFSCGWCPLVVDGKKGSVGGRLGWTGVAWSSSPVVGRRWCCL